MTLGYDRPLYILPFDHRASFEQGLFGWSGDLGPEQAEAVARAKAVIYDAFKLVVARGAPKEHAGVLVDSQFGAPILKDARQQGFITCMPTEKSGQAEFQFENGDRWADEIEKYQPTFVKALVRHNPEDDEAMNRRQTERLRRLCDHLHAHGRLFMFELLVPMTHQQSDRLEGDHQLYDRELRPSLMIAAIKELQGAGVEPDVWKVEGLDLQSDCVKISETARRDGRDRVGCIVLGRGSDEAKVRAWLRTAALTPGFIGFAVGRTSFWDALEALEKGQATREQAVEQIASRYAEWVRIFTEGKRA
jgi:myo-inositol catabolism protein IolC